MSNVMRPRLHRRRLVLAVAGLSALAASTTLAGLGGGLRSAVGGVSIDAGGVVRIATAEERLQMADSIRRHVDAPPAEAARSTARRVISLAGLQRAFDEQTTDGGLDDTVVHLAGLQRIDDIVIDESNNDILLVGPAGAWEVRDDGAVVSVDTGHSAMRLIDLVAALASVEQARQGGITCSIEPTAEGRRKLQALLRRTKLRPGQSPTTIEPAMRTAYGPQMIHINGVPHDSRIARTMVAADFEMKRIAMGLADSPVASLPSYLAMARNTAHASNANPRWWMATDYGPVAHDQNRTAYRITGDRVRTMTETDLIGRDGDVRGDDKADPVAQAWANRMTDTYDELAVAMPVFADLENVMDATVAATLIVQEDLEGRSGLSLDPIRNAAGLEPTRYAAPQSVDPQCSFIRGRKGWVVTASGGVDISGFEVVSNQIEDPAVAEKAEAILASRPADAAWFWDAD